jgi:hypothetical protein
MMLIKGQNVGTCKLSYKQNKSKEKERKGQKEPELYDVATYTGSWRTSSFTYILELQRWFIYFYLHLPKEGYSHHTQIECLEQ